MADEEHLRGASLLHANLTHASLRAADLRECRLVDTNIDGADFERALVHGASIWGLIGVPARQDNLVISSSDDAQVTVDDLEVAQFIYLLLNREKLRSVIQTMTSRAVLILGRFTPERKVILDALANEVRKHPGGPNAVRHVQRPGKVPLGPETCHVFVHRRIDGRFQEGDP